MHKKLHFNSWYAKYSKKYIIFAVSKTRMMLKRKLLYILVGTALSITASAQRQTMSLNDAILIAQQNSFDAQLARFSFMSSYWAYKSFRAELLPSMSITGGIMNFNHSRVEARNSEDGKINYVDNNSLTNSLTFSVDQQISSLGGTLSLQSYLYRLDQFDYKMTTYNTLPLKLSYAQPLRSYNELKWRKKSEPKEYERAKKVYLENIEDVAIQVASLYFDAISAQSDYLQNVSKYKDLEALYEISKKRLSLGTITKSDLLQLELSMLNTKVEVNNSKIKLDDGLFNLFSYLRVTNYQDVELTPPSNVMDMVLNADEVTLKALTNSSHVLEQDLSVLNAQQNLAKAKSAKGIQMQLNTEVGFNRTADGFAAAYRNLQDNEIIGVSITLPIFDWGVQKGKVMVAKSNLELAKTKKEQADNDYIQKIKREVLQFSFQSEQCRTSQKAQEISHERYYITKKRFEMGNISVTELNTALQELETAKSQYITQLKTYWTYYYSLRRYTLYDWVQKRALNADFDALIHNK